jgi:outer membrane protein assembly factor BamB
MSIRWRYEAVVMVICQVFVSLATAQPQEDDVRKAGWNKLLNGVQYGLPEHYSGLLTSLGKFKGNAKVHVVFDPKDRWNIEYKFVRDGREILSIQGHDQSAFAAEGDDLFFAHYQTSAAGCTIVAYDLNTGKQRWQTELHHEKPLGHSAYLNLVTLRISDKGEGEETSAGAAIVVTGMESYCDYVEVLDRRIGESLAIKNYRVGFAPPTPPEGAVGGEASEANPAEDTNRNQ